MAEGLAGIEYVGVGGCTQDCLEALMRILQSRLAILSAYILTNENHHGLLLIAESGDQIAIKSGFSSGYCGEGPNGFSRALCLLHDIEADVQEFKVEASFIRRLDASALTLSDMQNLEFGRSIRPSRWFNYVHERDIEAQMNGTLWKYCYAPMMPLAIIDPRIVDLARSFWNDPDNRLLTGYRRLEDVVRARTGSKEFGAKLYTAAFQGSDCKLEWPDCEGSEVAGRTSLFVGATTVYRNPRAHREVKQNEREALTEFLLLNHLFLLEAEASLKVASPPST